MYTWGVTPPPPVHICTHFGCPPPPLSPQFPKYLMDGPWMKSKIANKFTKEITDDMRTFLARDYMIDNCIYYRESILAEK